MNDNIRAWLVSVTLGLKGFAMAKNNCVDTYKDIADILKDERVIDIINEKHGEGAGNNIGYIIDFIELLITEISIDSVNVLSEIIKNELRKNAVYYGTQTP